MEGDSKTEVQDISNSELNGKIRLIVDMRIEDSGNFAVSSDTQIDNKTDTKSEEQAQNEETQDGDSGKIDDPDTES